MTESNERKPMTFTCQQLAAWWCGPGKCPMWCGLGRCQPVFAARAAAPQAQPSEQQAAKRRISVHGPGTWMSHPEVPQAQPAPAEQESPDDRSIAERLRDAGDNPLRAIVSLAAGFDADGATGPAEPLSWETVARMSIDFARAALARSPEPAPISDAEIDKIAAQQWGHATDFAAWRRFARAVLAEKGKPPCA